MDEDRIAALVALMRRHGIAELEHEAGGERIRLALDAAGRPAVAPSDTPETAAAPSDTPETAAAPGDAPSPPGSGLAVRAGMAGSFYRAPEPGAEPFVREGDKVDAGQTLGLLEAMKMMTAIEAPQAGTIAAIHAENGATVARGDLLFTLAPGGG